MSGNKDQFKVAGYSKIEMIALSVVLAALMLFSVLESGFPSEYRIRGRALIDSLLRVHGRVYVDSLFPDSAASVYISGLAKQDSAIYADTATVALNAATPTIVDTARLGLDADSLRGVAAANFLTRTQIDSALVAKVDTARVRSMIKDSLTFFYTKIAIDALILPKPDSSEVRSIVKDSLTNHYKKSEVVALVGDSLGTHFPITTVPYADSSGKNPIATGSVRGTVKIGAGLNVTADGTISASGVGGAAYTDSVTKDAVHVPGDSLGTEAQILQTVQQYLYAPVKYVADTSLTIAMNDSMDVFLDTESSETVIVARAKSSAAGIQNLTFQTVIENPQEFITLDSLNVTYKTTHASADSQKVNVYVGTLNRFTGAVALTDSAVNLSGTAYASQRLYIGDNSIGKDDVVIVRFRVWSKNSTKAVMIKRVYLTYGA